MRIALYDHQLGDFDRTVICDAPQIIAAQIDQHYVLGRLLFIGPHLLAKQQVLGLGLAPGPRAGDRAILKAASGGPDQHLRRSPQDGWPADLEVKHVRRWVDDPQGAIDLERMRDQRNVKTLRQYYLKCITCSYILFGLDDRRLELLNSQI